nr:MAG TPA: hypothetical protein [Caudoviricetes sp.]
MFSHNFQPLFTYCNMTCRVNPTGQWNYYASILPSEFCVGFQN